MNDLKQETLDVLAEIVALGPEVRMGQLPAHLGFQGEARLGTGLGDIDDDELLAVFDRHRTELSELMEAATAQGRVAKR